MPHHGICTLDGPPGEGLGIGVGTVGDLDGDGFTDLWVTGHASHGGRTTWLVHGPVVGAATVDDAWSIRDEPGSELGMAVAPLGGGRLAIGAKRSDGPLHLAAGHVVLIEVR